MNSREFVNRYTANMRAEGLVDCDDLQTETQIESIQNCSQTGSLSETRAWHESIKENNLVELERTPLSKYRGWIFGKNKIRHKSGAYLLLRELGSR